MVRLLQHLAEFQLVIVLCLGLDVEIEVAEFLPDLLDLGVVVVLKNLTIDIIELVLPNARASPELVDLLASQEAPNVGLNFDQEYDLLYGQVVDLSGQVSLRHVNSFLGVLV